MGVTTIALCVDGLAALSVDKDRSTALIVDLGFSAARVMPVLSNLVPLCSV